jgi:hypothetical protein
LKDNGDNHGLPGIGQQIKRKNITVDEDQIDQHDRQEHEATFSDKEAQVSAGVVSIKKCWHTFL